MQKIILLLAILFLPFMAFSQRSIKQFYNKYKNEANVTCVQVQGWMVKLVASFVEEDEVDKATKDVLKKITQLRILTMEGGNLVSKTDYNQLLRSVRADNFEDLMTVNDGDTKVHFLIREEDDIIHNILMLVSENDGFVMLSLEGKIKFKDLMNLKLDIEGGEHFKKLPTKKPIPTDVPRA